MEKRLCSTNFYRSKTVWTFRSIVNTQPHEYSDSAQLHAQYRRLLRINRLFFFSNFVRNTIAHVYCTCTCICICIMYMYIIVDMLMYKLIYTHEPVHIQVTKKAQIIPNLSQTLYCRFRENIFKVHIPCRSTKAQVFFLAKQRVQCKHVYDSCI